MPVGLSLFPYVKEDITLLMIGTWVKWAAIMIRIEENIHHHSSQYNDITLGSLARLPQHQEKQMHTLHKAAEAIIQQWHFTYHQSIYTTTLPYSPLHLLPTSHQQDLYWVGGGRWWPADE